MKASTKKGLRNTLIAVAVIAALVWYSGYREQFTKRSDEITLNEEERREIYNRLSGENGDFSRYDYEEAQGILSLFFDEDEYIAFEDAKKAFETLEAFISETLEYEDMVIDSIKASENALK